MRYLAFALILLVASPVASAWMCLQGKDSFTRCKPCGDIVTFTFAYNKVGALNCAYGCTTPCSAIPKLTLGGDAGPNPNCPGPDAAPLHFNYYAFATDDDQIRALAQASPPAAWFVTVLRDQAVIPPVALEEGETIDESVITAANIDLLLQGIEDDERHSAAALALEGDVSFVTTTRMQRLPNGHRVFVVESRVLDHPSGATLATPYPRFAVEIERVGDETRHVGGAEGNDATLWRVVSWGPPERYF